MTIDETVPTNARLAHAKDLCAQFLGSEKSALEARGDELYSLATASMVDVVLEATGWGIPRKDYLMGILIVAYELGRKDGRGSNG